MSDDEFGGDAMQVSEVPLPGQQHYGDSVFPLVVMNAEGTGTLQESLEWIGSRRERLLTQASQCGAVLFRGFPLTSPEDFDAFVTAFGLENFPYLESLSNAVRVNKTPRVFTANEAPPGVAIYLHHEMAQTPVFPTRLFFYCQKAAEEGGATPLCRSDILWEEIEKNLPAFAEKCEKKGLRYSNVMPSTNDLASGMGRSWQSTLRAETRQDAEDRLAGLGYSWSWEENGCLRATTPLLPAIEDLGDGRKSFFNQLIAAFQGWKDERNDPSKSITFGDGSRLDRSDVDWLTRRADELCFDVPWQAGDVALVDNMVVMHGRRTFCGTRQVLASLADPRRR
jgi:hypothetical protein